MISVLRVFVLLSVVLIASCKPSLEAIDFGNDQCNYCVMNIVDKMHAAQYVTTKGKQFKFDAIECMVNQIADLDKSTIAIMNVSDFANAGTMIDANSATFIISPKIKSPMGAYLSAVSTKQQAEVLKEKHTGTIYDWQGLQKQLSKQ